mgnify:CR=1 FL=1
MIIFRKLLRRFRKTEEVKTFEYVEKDTKCDRCDFFYKCNGNGDLIEITSLADERRHFARSLGCECKLLERD